MLSRPFPRGNLVLGLWSEIFAIGAHQRCLNTPPNTIWSISRLKSLARADRPQVKCPTQHVKHIICGRKSHGRPGKRDNLDSACTREAREKTLGARYVAWQASAGFAARKRKVEQSMANIRSPCGNRVNGWGSQVNSNRLPWRWILTPSRFLRLMESDE